jgi:5-deoxy-glucuronate isomerase
LTNWYYKAGTAASGTWDVLIGGSTPGWQFTGTKVGNFNHAEEFTLEADQWEKAIWALDGSGIEVHYEGKESGSKKLRGRESVFHGPADFLFLPRGVSAKVTGSGRFIVAEAIAKADKKVQFVAMENVEVTLRGAGAASRQIHDYGGVEYLDASAMIVVEVLVPSGNHSGIPQHKHDTYVPGVESNLEEIYYFELAPDRAFKKPDKFDAIASFRAYASDERKIDLQLEVRSGDVVLIPYGYHGPASAIPPYDLYFMNVMAGPDPDRSWNIVDDPNHTHARSTWDAQGIDKRLPYTA